MRVLVAGATGVIGRWLFLLLVKEGHEVIALSRRVVDVFDREALIKVLVEERPDAVMHR